MKEITKWYYDNIIKDKGYVFEDEFKKKFKAPCGRCQYGVKQKYPFEKILGRLYKCVKWEKPKKNWCDSFKKKLLDQQQLKDESFP